VMTSLLAAAEEGSVDAVSELMESSSHFDVNVANRVRLNYLLKVTVEFLCVIPEVLFSFWDWIPVFHGRLLSPPTIAKWRLHRGLNSLSTF